MKVNDHPETDSLYIDLSERPSVESREVSEGVVLDYDESGRLVGIDIDNASRKVRGKGERQMSNDPPERPAAVDADPAREMHAQRKFSLAEAIGRLAGPGIMKGVSPVTRKQQAEAEIQEYLGQHLADAAGALARVLRRQVGESELLLDNLDLPLVVLVGHVRSVLGSEYLLKELVREADVEWGRAFGERPHFEQEGRPPHSDDAYTAESVRFALSQLVEKLNAGDM